MNEDKIQLGKFLKKENYEFHFALSTDPNGKWIKNFRNVCSEMKLDADIDAYSFIVEPNRHFAKISGFINSSENELRLQLEKAVGKTNQKLNQQN